MRIVIGSIGVALLLILIAGVAAADTGFFVYGGGSTIQTNREEEDELLNTFEDVAWKGSWEGGVGMRIHPGGNSAGLPLTGDTRWEIRLRVGLLGGDLKNTHIVFSRENPPIYTSTTDEVFEYSGWEVGTSAIARLTPMFAFFAGPGIEVVKFKGDLDRVWLGEVPVFCGSCGDAQGKSDSSILYGYFEVGTRVTPPALPVGLEVFWTPRRVQMSSSQPIEAGEYKATFADLDDSWGFRLSYDF